VRRATGLALIALGVALLVLAPLLKFVAVPKVALAPLNLDVSDLSVAQGVVPKAADLAQGLPVTDVDLTARRQTTADVVASAQAGGNIGVYDSTNIVSLTKDGIAAAPFLPATPERYAFDRTTAVMVAAAGSNVDGAPITADKIGTDTIMPLKMPFFTEKKDYKVYDNTLLKGTTAKFLGEEAIDGLTVYKFEQKIDATNVGEQAGLAVWYQNDQLTWVEPLTGQVIKGSQDIKQWLKNKDGTDGLVIIEGKLTFTPEQIASNVTAGKTNSGKITLLSNVAPVILLVLGLALLVVGILLVRRPDSDV
jgi:Porin PorA